MTYQLRRYRILEGRLDEFVELWRNGVLPLRAAAGFELVGAWTSVETNEFIWIIGHDDFAAADAAYYSSDARKALVPNPADLIEASETLLMHPVSAQ